MINERKSILRALVGSQNYNLNGYTSDKDYVEFVIPTFEDLYKGKHYNKSLISDATDISYKDIRDLSKLLCKPSFNSLEMLFSEEIQFITNQDYTDNEEIEICFLLNALFDMKDDIAKMDLKALFNSCIGAYNGFMRKVLSQKTYQDKSYDTKSAMNAIRVLNIIKRFYDNNFTNFKEAIFYCDEDPIRKLLLGIKNETITKERFLKYAEIQEKNIVELCKPFYQQDLNKETKDKLQKLTELISKKAIFMQLNSDRKIISKINKTIEC